MALEQTAGDPIRFERQFARIEKCKAEMEQLSQRARQKRPAAGAPDTKRTLLQSWSGFALLHEGRSAVVGPAVTTRYRTR